MAVVDAMVFLNEKGEKGALKGGRYTWEYEVSSQKVWLRDEWHRSEGIVDHWGRTKLIVTSHRCGHPVPEWARLKFSIKKKVEASDACPF
jgi:hypothetical protein